MALRHGKWRRLDPTRELNRLLEKAEKLKARIRAKVEQPFQLVKQQFDYAKVRYRGLAKNTALLTMLLRAGQSVDGASAAAGDAEKVRLLWLQKRLRLTRW